jgi:hypothetical protein
VPLPDKLFWLRRSHKKVRNQFKISISPGCFSQNHEWRNHRDWLLLDLATFFLPTGTYGTTVVPLYCYDWRAFVLRLTISPRCGVEINYSASDLELWLTLDNEIQAIKEYGYYVASCSMSALAGKFFAHSPDATCIRMQTVPIYKTVDFSYNSDFGSLSYAPWMYTWRYFVAFHEVELASCRWFLKRHPWGGSTAKAFVVSAM